MNHMWIEPVGWIHRPSSGSRPDRPSSPFVRVHGVTASTPRSQTTGPRSRRIRGTTLPPDGRHPTPDYHSGDDFTVEFLDYRYRFAGPTSPSACRPRRSGSSWCDDRDLEPGEMDDLVALAARRPGRKARARRSAPTWPRTPAELDALHADPLVYWLRKLVFRGAWLDHRLKAGMLDVSFDESSGAFAYRMPTDQAPVVDVAPVPSWAELRFTELAGGT